ncbi:MAG: N-acetyl-gamma-glutamyl-phosphate reductase [Ruminococcaceae bacterium]|nr:N-acetyl-gamma-glutamyl-phosphate reductase [Oscillospiraceae bacterium]
MLKKVFIDGSAGTTGLRIYDRLKDRTDIKLITLCDELRKDVSARKEALNNADIAFLCLPDKAAIEAVSLIENENTAVIDTSTAHRVLSGWTYGFAELLESYDEIRNSKRIANPGCHASGFNALVAPLTKAGVLKKSAQLSCFSLTGYSGGGKQMIAQYEDDARDTLLDAPRMYGLTQNHKHIPEMVKVSELENAPAFCPVVSDFYAGMQVTVPIFKSDLNGSLSDIKDIYKSVYSGKIVHFDDVAQESGFMSSNAFALKDDMQITVCGNDDRILLVSRFDNLGKGASGSAIQNMNILLGADECTGLNI